MRYSRTEIDLDHGVMGSMGQGGAQEGSRLGDWVDVSTANEKKS